MTADIQVMTLYLQGKMTLYDYDYIIGYFTYDYIVGSSIIILHSCAEPKNSSTSTNNQQEQVRRVSFELYQQQKYVVFLKLLLSSEASFFAAQLQSYYLMVKDVESSSCTRELPVALPVLSLGSTQS
jgi:hypothetical protein